MCLMHVDYYEAVEDYLHPNIHTFVNHYRCKNLIDLPPCHGCDKVNKNGTRQQIQYQIGEQCILSTEKCYWRKPKAKYKR